MRILAVDDDPVFLQLLTTVLDDAGYDAVKTAESAADAITILSSEEVKFDCFLLDIKMPGMCGIELCEKIRALPEYHDTPIVMLTALMDETSIKRAFDAGATDYVTKPLRGLELGSRIRLAAQLNESRERNLALLQSRILAGPSSAGGTNGQRPAFMALSRFAGVVHYLELENYMLRIGEDVCAMRMCALAIAGYNDHVETLGETERGDLLRDLASSISRCTKNPQSLIAHAGDGVLVMVSKGLYRISTSAIEDVVHRVLASRLGRETAARVDVSIRLEHRKNPKICSGRRAAERLRSIVQKTAGELDDLDKRRHLQALRAFAPEQHSLKDFFRSEMVRPRRILRLHP